jgi:hypothetical protein
MIMQSASWSHSRELGWALHSVWASNISSQYLYSNSIQVYITQCITALQMGAAALEHRAP